MLLVVAPATHFVMQKYVTQFDIFPVMVAFCAGTSSHYEMGEVEAP